MFDWLRPKKSTVKVAAGTFRRLVDRYLATVPSPNRTLPQLERGREEYQQLRPWERLTAIAIGRDMHRNQSKFVTMENLRRQLVAGKVKAQFNTADDAWNAAAGEYFNTEFGRDSVYGIPRMHFAELVQHIEAAKLREGDILIAYDDDLFVGSGKLMIFEADQLVNVLPGDWASEKNPYRDCIQKDGVILDDFGAVRGYIVSRANAADERQPSGNLTSLPLDRALLIDTENAVLAMYRYRINQIRGVPEFLPVSTDMEDSDNMRKSELLTAKNMSKRLASVKHSDATSAMLDELAQLSMENVDDTAAAEVPEKKLERYRNFEEDGGAIVEYLQEGDSIDFHDATRPNLDTTAFYDHMNDTAGAAMGLAAGYTRMKVTNSYTAHRAESLLTWGAVRNYQKIAEWQYLDWIAEKVIDRAIRRGDVPPAPAGWRRKISWALPEMPAIDPQKDVAAVATKLKNGLTTYRQELGPDWRNTLTELASELAEIRELGIPAAILETVAGAPAVTEIELEPDTEV